jgi:DNA-binding response OmpR family regulator
VDPGLASTGTAGGASDRRELILIIEDNPDLREMLQSVVGGPYRTILAKDGAEGIALARSALPALVISDLVMPERNGYDVCRSLKSADGTRHIPVILITGRNELKYKLEGFECGADDYLAKPFNARELLARIRALLHGRALERALTQKNRELERALADLDSAQKQTLETERLQTAVKMAGALAHEINNPLAAILGLCDLIRAQSEAEAGHLADLQRIVDQAQRIADVVRRISALREVRFVPYVGDEEIVDLSAGSAPAPASPPSLAHAPRPPQLDGPARSS